MVFPSPAGVEELRLVRSARRGAQAGWCGAAPRVHRPEQEKEAQRCARRSVQQRSAPVGKVPRSDGPREPRVGPVETDARMGGRGAAAPRPRRPAVPRSGHARSRRGALAGPATDGGARPCRGCHPRSSRPPRPGACRDPHRAAGRLVESGSCAATATAGPGARPGARAGRGAPRGRRHPPRGFGAGAPATAAPAPGPSPLARGEGLPRCSCGTRRAPGARGRLCGRPRASRARHGGGWRHRPAPGGRGAMGRAARRGRAHTGGRARRSPRPVCPGRPAQAPDACPRHEARLAIPHALSPSVLAAALPETPAGGEGAASACQRRPRRTPSWPCRSATSVTAVKDAEAIHP